MLHKWGQPASHEEELFPARPPRTFGEWLPGASTAKGYVVATLAKQVGVSTDIVCDWIEDKRLPEPHSSTSVCELHHSSFIIHRSSCACRTISAIWPRWLSS